MEPAVGGRVLVPFRQQRMSGIVVDLHDRQPSVQTKNVVSVLDPAPGARRATHASRQVDRRLLSRAPLGEVFRTMLPLSAEFQRTITYVITEPATWHCISAACRGRRTVRAGTPEEQLVEFRVLDYLANRDDPVRENRLRSATRVSRVGARRNGAQEVVSARGRLGRARRRPYRQGRNVAP